LKNIKEDAYPALASSLADCLRGGECVLLSGELGMGKSALARAFIRLIAGDNDLEVPSPTYTLVQKYPCKGRDWDAIWHFDLYRVDDPEEIYELGIEEALENGLSLVEWPQRAQGLLPADALFISFLAGSDESCRTLTFTGAPRWKPRLKIFETLPL
jgi:tRNA threonylcarbamoyl adenosine modification protein YjeE